MTLPKISPAEARRLLDEGAVIVDIRNPDEHARDRIPGAANRPIGGTAPVPEGPAVIFHCKSGMRTDGNAGRLAALAGCPAYILEGGLDAWRAAGLPVEEDRSAPLEIMRQVQIAAGGLVLLGVALSLVAAPAFIGLAAFVGAGLMVAGVTGWCGMARLLALMPWNRKAGTAG